jgi:Tfp pilus assembly protein PilO
MPPLKLSKRERNLVMVALGAAIFYIFYQFLLIPKLDEIGTLGAKADKLRLDVKVTESKIKILEAVEKRFGEMRKEQKPVVAPTEEKALEVLRSLSETTSRSRLKLISIRPMIDEKEATMKFELSCAGDYRQLYEFLEILHSLKVLVLVDFLSVAAASDPANGLDIRMSLTAHY